MYLSVIRIYPPFGQAQTFIETLDSLRPRIVNTPNCLGFSVFYERAEDEVVGCLEQWRSREALEEHLRSTLYSRVLELMDQSKLPPKITFYEAMEVGGLDVVERARIAH